MGGVGGGVWVGIRGGGWLTFGGNLGGALSSFLNYLLIASFVALFPSLLIKNY